MPLPVPKREMAAVQFICAACGCKATADMEFYYHEYVEYRGRWMLVTEVEQTHGDAECDICGSINKRVWPKRHEETRWVRADDPEYF